MNRTLNFKKKDNNKGGVANVPNGAKMKVFELMLKTLVPFFLWSSSPVSIHHLAQEGSIQYAEWPMQKDALGQ